MSPVVSARLLGPPRVLLDGNPPPAELLWRKHLALCLVLWGAPERQRSRDQLIGLLWSETTDRAARHSLNEALRVIRRAAGADAIDASGDSISWVTPPQLDIGEFAGVERNDPTAAAALIGGAYCDGFSVPGAQEFDAWLAAERDRWQSRLVDVLVRAGAFAEDRGDARNAVGFAERALALNPHSDLAAQAAVRAYWIGGDRAAALAIAESHRLRLEQDLGVEVDDRTAALVARIARERAPARPAAHSGETRRAPLIGREAVLGALLHGWRDANTARGPALLVVSGASGSGRSRVLDEFVSRAALEGATVATLRAVEIDANDEYAAIAGLAVSGVQLAPGVAAAAPAALAAFVVRMPVWAERFHAALLVEAMPLRDAFTAVIVATADERPVVLAIDDADRLHPDELLWFTSFLRAMAGVSVTVLLTVQTGVDSAAVDDVIRRAGRDTPGVAARLEPLVLADLRRLVDASTDDWSDVARDRLTRRLWAESAGSPLIAVDVLYAVQHGLGTEPGAAWPAADRTLDATLPTALPEPLIAATRIAFRRLTADARELLSAAALLNEPFSAEQVGRVTGIEDAVRRDAALDALEWEDWIVADGRGYTFPARTKRRLIGSELMTPGQRRRLEERIAACR